LIKPGNVQGDNSNDLLARNPTAIHLTRERPFGFAWRVGTLLFLPQSKACMTLVRFRSNFNQKKTKYTIA
jgi:hypothetical protein